MRPHTPAVAFRAEIRADLVWVGGGNASILAFIGISGIVKMKNSGEIRPKSRCFHGISLRIMPKFRTQSDVQPCPPESWTPEIALRRRHASPEIPAKSPVIQESGEVGIQTRFMPTYFTTAYANLSEKVKKGEKSVDLREHFW